MKTQRRFTAHSAGVRRYLNEKQLHIVAAIVDVIRRGVDKFAKADAKGNIRVSVFDLTTRTAKQVTMTYAQVEELYTDLYGDPVERWRWDYAVQQEKAVRNKSMKALRQEYCNG